MSNVPGDLKYTKSHEWVRVEDDGSLTIGITDHAQGALGDLVYVEAPEAGTELAEGDVFAVVESVKAASDVYTPVAGEVIEGNEGLADTPEVVNNDPYGEGWLMKLKPSDPAGLDNLLDAAGYEQVVADEEH